jgi:hypothetical protein
MAIVAGGNASPVLDAIDGPLDDIALPVEDLVISKEELAVSSWRDDGLRAALLQPLAQGSAVITFVGNDILGRRHEFEAALGRFEIIGVSRREQDHPGSASGVGYEVDFGGPAADATANGLMLGPPFPPAELRCALTIVESIISRSGGSSQRLSIAKILSQIPRLAQRTKRL